MSADNWIERQWDPRPRGELLTELKSLRARVAEKVAWAVERWNAEVRNRPLQNVHRAALDTTWRQVIRHFGGDPDALLPLPEHYAMASKSGVGNEPDLTVSGEARHKCATSGKCSDLDGCICSDDDLAQHDANLERWKTERIHGSATTRAEVLEEIIAERLAHYETLIDAGKGEHGKPGYVTDATWYGWLGQLSAYRALAGEKP